MIGSIGVVPGERIEAVTLYSKAAIPIRRWRAGAACVLITEAEVIEVTREAREEGARQ